MESNLCVKNNLSELQRLTEFIQIFGRDRQLSGKTIHNLVLCLEEIFSNIVHYAYDDAEDHHIWVYLVLDGDIVKLEVKDNGKPFNPTELPELRPKSFDELGIGGLGIQMVRGLSDTMAYQHENGHNILTITFGRDNCPTR